jgi:hypothetical protein
VSDELDSWWPSPFGHDDQLGTQLDALSHLQSG